MSFNIPIMLQLVWPILLFFFVLFCVVLLRKNMKMFELDNCLAAAVAVWIYFIWFSFFLFRIHKPIPKKMFERMNIQNGRQWPIHLFNDNILCMNACVHLREKNKKKKILIVMYVTIVWHACVWTRLWIAKCLNKLKKHSPCQGHCNFQWCSWYAFQLLEKN